MKLMLYSEEIGFEKIYYANDFGKELGKLGLQISILGKLKARLKILNADMREVEMKKRGNFYPLKNVPEGGELFRIKVKDKNCNLRVIFSFVKAYSGEIVVLLLGFSEKNTKADYNNAIKKACNRRKQIQNEEKES